MKQSAFLCVAAVLALLVATGGVQAQQRGGRGGFGGMRGMDPILAVLGMEEVHKELKLAPEQVDKLKTIQEGLMASFAGVNFQQLSDEERQKLRDEMAKKGKDAREKVMQILNDDQKKRAKELAIQQAGPQSLGNDEVATALKLTGEQKKKIATITEQMGTKIRELFQAGPDGFEKIGELRETTDKELMALLTPEQSKQFASLKGKPFEFPQGGFGGRRGGGNRPARPTEEKK